jgi:hypothetical protein
MTGLTLSLIVASVVAGCTLLVVVLGVLIDRSAATHERGKGRY